MWTFITNASGTGVTMNCHAASSKRGSNVASDARKEGRTSDGLGFLGLRPFMKHATFHDHAHLANCRDCSSRISIDGDQISKQTWPDGPQSVIEAERFAAIELAACSASTGFIPNSTMSSSSRAPSP